MTLYRQRYLSVLKYTFHSLCLDFERVEGTFPSKQARKVYWGVAKQDATKYMSHPIAPLEVSL